MAKNLRNPSQNLNSLTPKQRPNLMKAGGLFALTAVKRANEARSSTAILADDAELQLRVPSGFWLFRIEASLNMTAAQNIRYSIGAGEGAVIEANTSNGRGRLFISGAAPQEDLVNNILITVTGGTTSAWTSLDIRFFAYVTQGGAITLQWAQNVSGAAATTIQAGSVMTATLITP